MTLVARRLDSAAVTDAARRIAPHVRRTPTEHSAPLTAAAGRDVFLKLENLQHTGAFKIRGALNAMLQLDARERERGVITASAGNHGQGVAFAAQLVGIPARVVLPHGVPIAKLVAIQRLGAEPILADGGYDGAHATAVAIAKERGLRYVHAFDDDAVIAGQGTLALELLADAEVDTIVVPIGGGGLAAGVALALGHRRTRPRLIGVQASGADAFAASFAGGAIAERPAATIADGIAVRRPAERTFEILRAALDDIVTVDDEAIARAIVMLLERHKLVAEGAGAAAIAAILEGNGHVGGRKVAAIVSGGNIDPNTLTKVLQQGLVSAGRFLAFRTWLDDRPGMLHEITGVLAAERINILHVGIHRLGPYAALGRVGLDVIVDTRDRAHAEAILALIRGRGFPAEELLDTAPRG